MLADYCAEHGAENGKITNYGKVELYLEGDTCSFDFEGVEVVIIDGHLTKIIASDIGLWGSSLPEWSDNVHREVYKAVLSSVDEHQQEIAVESAREMMN